MSNNKALELKIILLGEAGVGKTSIINRYIKDTFDQNEKSSSSMSFASKEIERNKQKIRLNIWDTIGQEKFRSLSKMFLNDTKIVILVYSIISKKSFDELDFWLKLYKDNLEEDIILGVAANKVDLFEDQEVEDELGKEYANKNGAIFSLLSAKENKKGVDLFLEKLVDAYLSKKNPVNNNQDKRIKLDIKKIENKDSGGGSCCGGQNQTRRKRYNSIVQSSNGFVNSVFLGDDGVGKTSIIKRILGKQFNKNEEHTEEIKDFLIEYNNKTMRMTLKIYDVNNEKKKTKDFIKILKTSNIFFIIYDIKNKKCLDSIGFWIEAIRKCKEDSKKDENYLLYIIGNKNDSSNLNLKEEKGIIINNKAKIEKFIEEGKEITDKLNVIFGTISALENKGIDNIIKEAMEKYLSLP